MRVSSAAASHGGRQRHGPGPAVALTVHLAADIGQVPLGLRQTGKPIRKASSARRRAVFSAVVKATLGFFAIRWFLPLLRMP